MNSSDPLENQHTQDQATTGNKIQSAVQKFVIAVLIAGSVMSTPSPASGSPHPITGTRALSKVYLPIPPILERLYLNPQNQSTFYLGNASEEHMQMLIEYINALSANNIDVSKLRIAGHEGTPISDMVKTKDLLSRIEFYLMLLVIQNHRKELKQAENNKK